MNTDANTEFLCAAVNQAVNAEPYESGYSPSQWVLGKNLRLPYDIMSPASKLSQSIGEDKNFDTRIAIMAAAKRSITALKYNRRQAKAFSSISRAEASLPAQHLYNVGDQCYYWRGVTKTKSMGPTVDGAGRCDRH